MIYLVRHAHAGDRTAWSGEDDRLRPLSDKGWRQAERIATTLADAQIACIVSSPSVRCLQTVGPLSRACKIDIDGDPRVYEGADVDDALALIGELLDREAVICSHGDVIPEVIDALRRRGVQTIGRGCEKASIWQLEVAGTVIVRATYSGRAS